MEYIKEALEFVFPTKDICYFCRSEDSKVENYICKSCNDKVARVHKEVFLGDVNIERCFYTTIYDSFMKDIIKKFKFNDKSFLYKALADILLETIYKENIKDKIDIISFVPSHRRKEAVRGYNQVELLAKFISKELDLPIFNGLFKARHTPDQHFLDELGRRKNLKDAFRVRNKEEIKGKRILLLDDILTSGSTMKMCAKELIKNEAKTVFALALTSSRKL
ncbi:MAG: ComF family protein [Tissierella sp.]|uniref:ComF family protein n=1 Tax=Tissierella sp. TaxID=41274 RepID=UPI003F95FD85